MTVAELSALPRFWFPPAKTSGGGEQLPYFFLRYKIVQ